MLPEEHEAPPSSMLAALHECMLRCACRRLCRRLRGPNGAVVRRCRERHSAGAELAEAEKPAKVQRVRNDERRAKKGERPVHAAGQRPGGGASRSGKRKPGSRVR